MEKREQITLDGNEATASIAHRLSEVIAIYPITPSSAMGELSDEWSAAGRKNIWGQVPQVIEMQSEGGAAGAVHGALQGGALSTTFTASQGLLLMIPNMYKIAGELTPLCIHVAARAIATHALSIFGDHSDVMAVRQTGFAMLCSASVQEAHDFACIAHMATLKARIPFVHFFDGFRTSHEVAKIQILSDDDLRSLFPNDALTAHRSRGLSPDRPVLRGSAQNPDAFFQAREACNRFYEACPDLVREEMKLFAQLTGRKYDLFEYSGDPQAEKVIVLMGSGIETACETVDYLNAHGAKLGVLKVRLYRPFVTSAFLEKLPSTTKAIAVLDRTKEPGAVGEPLLLDVIAAIHEGHSNPQSLRIIGGRYGLASKEFTPAMVKAVFDELARPEPKRRFTVGISDDVTNLSLPIESDFDIEAPDVRRAVFFGLGADGTVGANKNSIKIIGEETDLFAQGYFVYDSKKSGAMTVSHLRFGPRPIRSTYLIGSAQFVACHQFNFLERQNVLETAAPAATFLLNSPYPPEIVWDKLPFEVQEQIVAKKLRLFVIDAQTVARECGMGARINTIMQVCFFALSGVLPREQAIECIKHAIQKTYGKKGEEVVRRNFVAVDSALEHLKEVEVPDFANATHHQAPVVSDLAPEFVKRVSAMMLGGEGNLLPVSAFPVDGTWPTATSQWEKRNLALEIPAWEPDICVQCNKCALVCPHAAIRPKVYDPKELQNAPETFKSANYRGADFSGMKYTIQIAPEDCTGCTVCVQVCPAKDKGAPKRKAINMTPQAPLRDRERENYKYFLDLPEPDRTKVEVDVKGSQFLQPLFEYSGACAGCGETPYIKLLTQLFGDRTVIANATGCSSIYGGNLPTTPYCVNKEGRGPAWANSLFEDNAEFGLGIRVAFDAQVEQTRELLKQLSAKLPSSLADEILSASQNTEAEIAAQRRRVETLKQVLAEINEEPARILLQHADLLVEKMVWIVGGDGWAYDIGFGGLDHVLSSHRKVKVLVLDTEVYSNTGGQASKATPLGAAAKFAASGKATGKKDLGMMAMSYGHVYVAQVAYGARDLQTLKAIQEAASYPGPALIIAYSPCIAHGYDLAFGLDQQKNAVGTGYWPLYRFDPRRTGEGQNPLQVDYSSPKQPISQFMERETRFKLVEQQNADRYREFVKAEQATAKDHYAHLEKLAQKPVSPIKPASQPSSAE